MSDFAGPSVDQTREPGGAAPVLLDEIALDKLRALDPDGRRGVLNRVLMAFESSLSRWVNQLERLPDAAEVTAVAHVAHTLKSSAASVGAKDLARACADVELRLRHGDPVDLPLEVSRIVTLGHAALAAIRAMLRP